MNYIGNNRRFKWHLSLIKGDHLHDGDIFDCAQCSPETSNLSERRKAKLRFERNSTIPYPLDNWRYAS